MGKGRRLRNERRERELRQALLIPRELPPTFRDIRSAATQEAKKAALKEAFEAVSWDVWPSDNGNPVYDALAFPGREPGSYWHEVWDKYENDAQAREGAARWLRGCLWGYSLLRLYRVPAINHSLASSFELWPDDIKLIAQFQWRDDDTIIVTEAKDIPLEVIESDRRAPRSGYIG